MQIATAIAVYANWGFTAIKGIGWGWAGIIWLYNFIFYFPLDIIKFMIRYALSGRQWDHLFERKVPCYAVLQNLILIHCHETVGISC